MLKKNNKKHGFTLVELLVVIAILAILAAVTVVGYTGFTKKAKQSNDEGVVTQVNRILQADEALGAPKTMHEALMVAEENGLIIEKLTPNVVGNDFVWNSKTNRFVIVDPKKPDTPVFPKDAVLGNKLDCWKLVDKYDETSPYSQYLKDKDFNGADLTINVTTGIDLGKNTETFNLKYTRDDAADPQSVIIRTNNSTTNLEVSAKNDTVMHYGNLGKLNIVKVAANSYHENGQTAYAKIAAGRIKIESNSKISVILVDNKVDATTIKVEKEPSAKIEKVFVEKAISPSSNQDLKDSIEALEAATENKPVVNKNEAKEEAQIQTEIQQAVQESAKEDTNKGELLVVDGAGESSYITLAQFRDNVNGGNSYDGAFITLMQDIDLKGVEWEPIGTEANPFKGKFDGKNYQISNLSFTTAGKAIGLFGYVEGVKNTNYNPTSTTEWNKIWNGYLFINEPISKDKYSCSISNLKLDNFNIITKTSEANHANRYLSALVGQATNAYIDNIHVSHINILGHKYLGTTVGFAINSVLNNLTNDANCLISATNNSENEPSGNVAGVIGKTNYSVIMNVENNASVETSGAGSFAGIVAFGEKNTVLYNCTNNANFIIEGVGPSYIGGINGYCTSSQLCINCTNNGIISVGSTAKAYPAGYSRPCPRIDGIGGIAGLMTNSGSKFYNCKNTANLSGATPHIGGVAGCILSSSTFILDNCNNTGTLDNKNYTYQLEDSTGQLVGEVLHGKSGTLLANVKNLSLHDLTYETLGALISDLPQPLNEIETISFVNVSINTPQVFEVPTNIKSIISTTNFCTTIALTNPLEVSTLNLDIPDLEIVIDKDLSNLNLKLSGMNNKITVSENGKLNNLSVYGNNSEVILNGSNNNNLMLNRLILGGNNTKGTINVNSWIHGVSFSGKGKVTLNNNGKIAQEVNVGNNHVISCQDSTTVVINNYGKIEGSAPVDATEGKQNSYTLLFYNGCDVTVNCYDGSHLNSIHPGIWSTYLIAASSCKKVTINYVEGATLHFKTTNSGFDADNQWNIAVNAKDRIAVNKVTSFA